MFEGNEQHDAHELLGCLMAYIQDAVVEINKHREKNQTQITSEKNCKNSSSNGLSVKCGGTECCFGKFT